MVNPGSSEVALREKVLYHSNWEGQMSSYIHYTVYTRAISRPYMPPSSVRRRLGGRPRRPPCRGL